MSRPQPVPVFGDLTDMAIVAGYGKTRDEIIRQRIHLTARIHESSGQAAANYQTELTDLNVAAGFGRAAAQASITDPPYGAPRLAEEDYLPTPEGFLPYGWGEDWDDEDDI